MLNFDSYTTTLSSSMTQTKLRSLGIDFLSNLLKFRITTVTQTEKAQSSTPALVPELHSEKINWRNTDLWSSSSKSTFLPNAAAALARVVRVWLVSFSSSNLFKAARLVCMRFLDLLQCDSWFLCISNIFDCSFFLQLMLARSMNLTYKYSCKT